MVNVKRLVVGAACAITVAVAPIVVMASPAPVAPAAGATVSGQLSTGHLFGKATGTLARQVPAGPQHGKIISQFARNNNPSNFHIHKHAQKSSHKA